VPLQDEDVREALSGNLCRCTGYESIVRAVVDAAHDVLELPAGLEITPVAARTGTLSTLPPAPATAVSADAAHPATPTPGRTLVPEAFAALAGLVVGAVLRSRSRG
jgi:xanthine dehydrogenase iron-sulfur cluster and FAD-binding subunit A